LTTPGERLSERRGILTEPQQLLSALLRTSTVGVGIFDRQMRFQAVNDTLASMNGLPSEAHIGKTIHQILGNAATKVACAFQHVLTTGEPLSNFKLTAQLPTRTGIGHWIEDYYPIKNESGKVLQIGVIVLEVTKKKSIEQALCRLSDGLRQATEALKKDRIILGQLNHRTNERVELLARPHALLENCISQARIVSELLRPPLRLAAVRHHQANFHPELGQTTSAETRLSPHGSPMRISDLRAERLSNRERQVVQHLAEGNSNRQMAAILNISIRTVETYRGRMMLKLGLHSIAELVRYAVRNNII
jgi:PAS domain S-box-containing protein